MRVVLLAACGVLAGCTTFGPEPEPPSLRGLLVQGMVGATEIDVSSSDPGGEPGSVDADGDTTLPAISAALQYPLTGERARVGVETGFATGWEGDFEAVVVSSGGTLIVSENDIFVSDLFCGAYGELALGAGARLYAGVGALLQYGSVDLDYDDGGPVSLDEDGFGTGFYARAGIEMVVTPGTYLGIGVRVSESDLQLGGGIDDLDVDQTQWFVTVARGW